MPGSGGSLARARYLPLAVAGLTSLALMAALFAAWRTLVRAEKSLGVGEAQHLVQSLHRYLSGGPPTLRQLELALAGLESSGLCYVRLQDDQPGLRPVGTGRLRYVMPPPPGPPPGSLQGMLGRLFGRPPPPPGAGWPAPPPPPSDGDPVPPTREGKSAPAGEGPPGRSVFQALGPAAGAPPGGLSPAAGSGRPPRLESRPGWGEPGRRPPPRGGPAGRGPPLGATIEFEPQVAGTLRLQAQRLAALGGAVVLVLWAGGLLLVHLMNERVRATLAAVEDRRLREVGRASAVLAHELRNPLASLKGHAQLLEEALDGSRREKATTVVQEAVRLESLISGLLDFLRSGRVTPKDSLLQPILMAAKDKSIAQTVEVDLEDRARRVSVDAARLEQAVVNLLDNAEDAAPGELIALRARIVGAEVEVSVEDQGPGLEAEGAGIFDPLYSTKPSGTGLGLALVREVAVAHGGSAGAEPGARGGARLFLRWPRRAEPTSPF